MAIPLREPLTERAVHLCVDMQRLFTSDGPWPTPWMARVLPVVTNLVARFPERTVFTRFIPPETPDGLPGAWRQYYRRWREATREQLDPHLIELVPGLAAFAPPATVINKTRYSGFAASRLSTHLAARGAEAVIVSGAETDVCVLATVLGAVDRGYRVVIVSDALCSGSDEGHDALLRLYGQRFSEQIEVADSATVLACWK